MATLTEQLDMHRVAGPRHSLQLYEAAEPERGRAGIEGGAARRSVRTSGVLSLVPGARAGAGEL